MGELAAVFPYRSILYSGVLFSIFICRRVECHTKLAASFILYYYYLCMCDITMLKSWNCEFQNSKEEKKTSNEFTTWKWSFNAGTLSVFYMNIPC